MISSFDITAPESSTDFEALEAKVVRVQEEVWGDCDWQISLEKPRTCLASENRVTVPEHSEAADNCWDRFVSATHYACSEDLHARICRCFTDDPEPSGIVIEDTVRKSVMRLLDVFKKLECIRLSKPTTGQASVFRIWSSVARQLRDDKSAESARFQWTDEKNERRCKLVDKEIDDTLTPEEQRELEVLQSQMLAYRREVAPLPLNDLRQLHQELLRASREDNE